MWQDALHRGLGSPGSSQPLTHLVTSGHLPHRWVTGRRASWRVSMSPWGSWRGRHSASVTQASADPTDVRPELGRPFGGVHAEVEASPRSPLRPALGGVALVPGRFLPLRVAASATVPAAGEQGLVLQRSGAMAPTHQILSQPPTHGVRLHSACH